jgi:8-oxo-dGTP pyrophosphatase MutT (NUDIX family)
VAEPPADAVPPKPAATAVLLRDAAAGPELLLLKRLRTAGFVPGAYVFPGGRVDTADADPELLALLGDTPRGPEPAFWLATIREVFEETGVLLARGGAAGAPGAAPDGAAAGGSPAAGAAASTPPRGAVESSGITPWREALLAGEAGLLDVLRALDARPDISRMVYCSHWITPVAEPKRYDTRFFLAELPQGAVVTADPREMSEALWLSPAAALEGFRRGELPMVFPTVKTIQRLAGYDSVAQVLAAFRAADVPPILPRLVRTAEGIGIVMPDGS